MTSTLGLGLLLQLIAVGLMLVTLRGRAVRSAGFYFVAAAAGYHGLTEVLQILGKPSVFRLYTTQDAVDDWTVLVGATLILFAVAYLLVWSRPRAEVPVEVLEADRAETIRILNPRVLLLLTLPMALVVGRSTQEAIPGYASAGLTSQFLVLLAALTAIAVAARKPRLFAPAVFAAVLILSLVGQRRELVLVGVMAVVGLSLLKIRPSGRQVVASAAALVLLIVGINAVRAQIGRETFTEADGLQRIEYIVQALVARTAGEPPLTEQQPTGTRLDGNGFAPVALQRLNDHSVDPVGLETVVNNVLLAIPSFLYPEKLSSALTERSEGELLRQRFGYTFQYDFLPTHLGVSLTYFGPFGLLFIGLLLGAAAGGFDRFVQARPTAIRLLLGIGGAFAVLSYETSGEIYPITARGLLLAIAVVLLARTLPRFRPTAPRSSERSGREHPLPAPVPAPRL